LGALKTLRKNCPTYEKMCKSLGLFFEPEDGGNVFLKNISKALPGYMASHPK
jgi:hypothetical protein